jgi:hypothetical protein
MITKTINLYTFDELTPTAQDKAINNLSDINTSHSWWETVYDDAKNIGLIITGFDIDRGRTVDGRLNNDIDTCIDTILKDHGSECETYKIALKYRQDYNALVEKFSDGIKTNKVAEGNEDEFDTEADYIEAEFKTNLNIEYLSILSKEYDYLTSREQIIETINANEYTFTEDGKLETL